MPHPIIDPLAFQRLSGMTPAQYYDDQMRKAAERGVVDLTLAVYCRAVVDRLRQIPPHAGAVASVIRAHNVKGECCVPIRCPLTNFVRQEIGCTVMVGSTHFSVYYGDRSAVGSLPSHVTRFIRHFDAGDYPALIETQEENGSATD